MSTFWKCEIEICMLNMCMPASVRAKYTTHARTSAKNSPELVDTTTKKCLQMNGIDLFSLFRGVEWQWVLFEWKSAPFKRPTLPASQTCTSLAVIGMPHILMSQMHALIFHLSGNFVTFQTFFFFLKLQKVH